MTVLVRTLFAWVRSEPRASDEQCNTEVWCDSLSEIGDCCRPNLVPILADQVLRSVVSIGGDLSFYRGWKYISLTVYYRAGDSVNRSPLLVQ